MNQNQVLSLDSPSKPKPRNSNLELYRIVCMLLIVAHHFVVNSGLTSPEGPMLANSDSPNTLFLLLFGMWGKTGINCFLLITGYYMCTSKITAKKFLKLLLQIYLYNIIAYIILLLTGHEIVSLERLMQLIMPVWGFQTNFTSCFIAFYLTIPFLNILVNNMDKRQHSMLLMLLVGCYTILGSIPRFHVVFNYITWFGVIYLISSYIRLYPLPIYEKKQIWVWSTLLCVLLAMGSVAVMQWLFPDKPAYYFVADSNKILAVAVSVTSFLWFKNLKIKNSKLINAIGGSTFGVLLIHANSDAMRTWLWKDTLDCVGRFSLSLSQLALYSVGGVIVVFLVCNIIDQLRVLIIEKPFFRWYEKRFSSNQPIKFIKK